MSKVKLGIGGAGEEIKGAVSLLSEECVSRNLAVPVYSESRLGVNHLVSVSVGLAQVEVITAGIREGKRLAASAALRLLRQGQLIVADRVDNPDGISLPRDDVLSLYSDLSEENRRCGFPEVTCTGDTRFCSCPLCANFQRLVAAMETLFVKDGVERTIYSRLEQVLRMEIPDPILDSFVKDQLLPAMLDVGRRGIVRAPRSGAEGSGSSSESTGIG